MMAHVILQSGVEVEWHTSRAPNRKIRAFTGTHEGKTAVGKVRVKRSDGKKVYIWPWRLSLADTSR